MFPFISRQLTLLGRCPPPFPPHSFLPVPTQGRFPPQAGVVTKPTRGPGLLQPGSQQVSIPCSTAGRGWGSSAAFSWKLFYPRAAHGCALQRCSLLNYSEALLKSFLQTFSCWTFIATAGFVCPHGCFQQFCVSEFGAGWGQWAPTRS